MSTMKNKWIIFLTLLIHGSFFVACKKSGDNLIAVPSLLIGRWTADSSVYYISGSLHRDTISNEYYTFTDDRHIQRALHLYQDTIEYIMTSDTTLNWIEPSSMTPDNTISVPYSIQALTSNKLTLYYQHDSAGWEYDYYHR